MNGEKICDQVFEKIEKAANSLDRLEPWEQCVVRIYSAQGILDNASYRYFFEPDWEGQPDYSVFVNAYREIGCDAQAICAARVLPPASVDCVGALG
jgi:hypothetical protein